VGWFPSFADAKDQASLSLDGLLKECQTPFLTQPSPATNPDGS
jgi:hypothetical protein